MGKQKVEEIKVISIERKAFRYLNEFLGKINKIHLYVPNERYKETYKYVWNGGQIIQNEVLSSQCNNIRIFF